MLGNATSLVFGPAQFDQGLRDTGEWQADHIEVVAFDTRDIAAGSTLDGVSASLVVRLVSSEVTRDLFCGELGEMYQRGFDETAPFRLGEADQGNARYDGVRAAGELLKHVTSVVAGARFAEDAAFEGYDGVRGENDRGSDRACRSQLGFGVSETLDELARRLAMHGGFIDTGSDHDEGEACVTENLSAARRRGSEDELHGFEIR